MKQQLLEEQLKTLKAGIQELGELVQTMSGGGGGGESTVVEHEFKCNKCGFEFKSNDLGDLYRMCTLSDLNRGSGLCGGAIELKGEGISMTIDHAQDDRGFVSVESLQDVIKNLEDKIEHWIGHDGEIGRKNFRSGLSWAIGDLEDLIENKSTAADED
jgi:hypothetical protein